MTSVPDEALEAMARAARTFGDFDELPESQQTAYFRSMGQFRQALAEQGYAVVPVEPTPQLLEPFARVLCHAIGIDPDEPYAPHGEFPNWYGHAGPLARQWHHMISAAQQGRGDG